MVERWTEDPCVTGSIPVCPILTAGSPVATAADCKSATQETSLVRIQPCRFNCISYEYHNTPVAQRIEHTATNRSVAGSNPVRSAKKRWQSGRLHRIANPEIQKDPVVRILHASFLFFCCSRSAGGAAVLKTANPKGYAGSNPVCSVISRLEGRHFIFPTFCKIMVQFIRKVSDSEQTKRAVLNKQELL